MSLPFKNKYARVTVDDKLISVVELTGLEIIRNGKVEAKYGYMPSANGVWHSSRRHSKGPTFARFSIRRWFKTGLQQPLFFSLHNNHTLFTIQQYVTQTVEGLYKGLQLNNCQIYRYRLVTGGTNDIMAEEIIGEATSWEGVGIEVITIYVSAGASMVVFDGVSYSNGEKIYGKGAGEYLIQPSLAPWYAFDYWELSGDIAFKAGYDMWDSTAIVVVSGTCIGTITLHVWYYGC